MTKHIDYGREAVDELRTLNCAAPDAKDQVRAAARRFHNGILFTSDADLLDAQRLLKEIPYKLGMRGEFDIYVAVENLATAKPIGW